MIYTTQDLNKVGENYYITRKRVFSPYFKCFQRMCNPNAEKGDLEKTFDFAYEMSYGGGYHRVNRPDSSDNRTKGDIFINAFQGKLAEYAVKEYLKDQGINCTEPDVGVYGKGKWDSFDLECQGNYIAIKSTKARGNLLLLETNDWDENGDYTPNQQAGISSYDFIVLVRLAPDGEKIMGQYLKLSDSDIPQDIKERLKEKILNIEWKYDFAGYIYHNEIAEMIKGKKIIPAHAKLNGSTDMKAENYYFQSGCMHYMAELYQNENVEIERWRLKRYCPECGRELLIREKYSKFWGCSGFPHYCNYKEPFHKNKV